MPERAVMRASAFRIEELEASTDLLAMAGRCGGREPLFFWSHPDSGQAMLGLGVAAELRTQGPQRFRDAAALALDLLNRGFEAGQAPAGAPLPRVVGGFGFASETTGSGRWREFPPCRLIVPAQLWIREGSRCWLIRADQTLDGARTQFGEPALVSEPVSLPVDAGDDDESRKAWIDRVEHALELVGRGNLEKVVLTRTRTTTLEGDRVDVGGVVAALCERRPSCITYWMRGAHTDFVGSTPELLLRSDGLEFATESVAGTMSRGSSEEEDGERASALLASDKNRREQAAVSAAIAAALAPLAATLSSESEPRIRSLPEAHHLATAIQGRLREPMPALELAGLLHPTPAVCGTPQAEAYELIRCSDDERGWFTGGIGWMDAAGAGEFAVALRSALVEGNRVSTSAGAGIVAGSDPVDEYEETELKMRGLQAALTRGGS